MPREGEVDGRDYHFCSNDEFESLIAQGMFAEWAKYVDNYYGTSRATIEQAVKQGVDLLFDIELQGARQLKKVYPEATSVFLLPPSFEELSARLYGRGTDNPQKIRKRLMRGITELESAHEFDYLIVNDCIEQAMLRVEQVRDGVGTSVVHRDSAVNRLLAQMRDALSEHGE